MTKPRKPIRRVSTERAKQLREYNVLKPVFFANNYTCTVCDGFVPEYAKVLHHFFKRNGLLLCWVPGFRLTHWHCHERIHQNETEARARGWLAPKECCDDFERAQKHYESLTK